MFRINDYSGVGKVAALYILLHSISPVNTSYAQSVTQPTKPALEMRAGRNNEVDAGRKKLENIAGEAYRWGWGAPPVVSSPGYGMKLMRYSVDLATTKKGDKKPEVFEDLFKNLGIDYAKKAGSKEERHGHYKEEFERKVISLYSKVGIKDDYISILEKAQRMLFEHFSPEDAKQFEKSFGFKPNSGIWILIDLASY